MNIMNLQKQLIIYILAIVAGLALTGCASGFKKACKSGNDPEQIHAYIAKGEDPNKSLGGASGFSPLGHAVRSNKNPEIIKALLKAGANPNATPNAAMIVTPLQIAAYYNKPIAAQVLIEGGADVNFCPASLLPAGSMVFNKWVAMTPYQIAVAKGNAAVAEILLKAGAGAR